VLFTVVALELLPRIEMRAALLAIVLVGMCHVHLLMVVAGTARVRLMRSLSGDPGSMAAHAVPHEQARATPSSIRIR
jgi:hypothetical protein